MARGTSAASAPRVLPERARLPAGPQAAQTFKVRERLGQTSGGIIAPFPTKPKHMHWSTYLRTRAAAEGNELCILQDDLADVKRTLKMRR